MSYRFIIIGAGSAGCVLANRLSVDANNRVLLLEAGGRDVNPFIHMPAGLARLVHNRRINWHYYTEPEPALHGRRLYWPRGKVLGGSSSINAMCYIRGQREDYDGWAAAGNRGWSFAEVLPYFKRSERQQRGTSEYHGGDGLLCVEDLRERNPLTDAFVSAREALHLPLNEDFNGAHQEGIGYYQVTQSGGRRCSSAVAFLNPARERRNLTVITHAHVKRIRIEHGRAVGVEFQRNGEPRFVSCDGEVLVCAGAVNSPQLLMLSGIGPPDHLRAVGIPVRVPLAGVGANLQDHLDVCTVYRSTQPISYDFHVAREIQVGLRYWLTHRGPGTSNIAEAGGFIRSSYASASRPAIQLHFIPAQLDDHGRHRLPGHGFTVHACFLRPHSRGHIRLRSANCHEPPLIHARYLQASVDLDVMVDAVRQSRALIAARSFDSFRGNEVFPGRQAQATMDLIQFIRAKAETVYHPAGTCRMGVDEDAVVDSSLRVHGVDGLRVIDASIMPTLVSGNTNAPVIMIAEKAADMVLGAATEVVREPIRKVM